MGTIGEDSSGCTARLPTPAEPVTYRIAVRGVTGRGWPAPVGAAVEAGDGTSTITAVLDQAALRGLLCRLWDVNATVLAVTWVPTDQRSKGDKQDAWHCVG